MIGSKAWARGITYDAMQDDSLRNVSMETMVTPQQISDQVAFLCSARGRTISGQATAIGGDLQSPA